MWKGVAVVVMMLTIFLLGMIVGYGCFRSGVSASRVRQYGGGGDRGSVDYDYPRWRVGAGDL